MNTLSFDSALCPDDEILQAYIDNDIPPDEYIAILAHTSACPHCQAYLAHATQVLAALAEIAQEPVQLPVLEESYGRFVKHAPSDLRLGRSEPSPLPVMAEGWRQRLAGQLSTLPHPSPKKMAFLGLGIGATAVGLYVRHRRHGESGA